MSDNVEKFESIPEIISEMTKTQMMSQYSVGPLPQEVLTDLTDEDLSIKGYKEAMTSALPSSCHDEILKRAVELAKVAYTGGIQEALIVGNQSSTDIGHVSNQKN